jgi:hypothetical protein
VTVRVLACGSVSEEGDEAVAGAFKAVVGPSVSSERGLVLMIWEWASDGRALVLMSSETIGRGSWSGLNEVDRPGLV